MIEQVNIANQLEPQFFIRKYITPNGVEYLELSVCPDKGFIYVVDYYIEGTHYCPKTTESAIGRTMPINAVYEQAEGLTPVLVSDLPSLNEYREYKRDGY